MYFFFVLLIISLYDEGFPFLSQRACAASLLRYWLILGTDRREFDICFSCTLTVSHEALKVFVVDDEQKTAR